MTSTPIPLAGVVQSADHQSAVTAIYDHWLSASGLPGRYVPLTISADDLGEVIRVLPRAGFVGLNITRPFQRLVLDHADIITDRAALMSGANTIIFRKDGKIHADNTDGYGFIENIRQGAQGWNPKSGPAAVFGAGRAAREVVAALLEVGVEEIRIANRTRPRAEALRAEFGTRIVVTDWVKGGNIVEGAMTIVNATPLGSPGQQDFRVPLDGLTRGAVVSDLAIAPEITRLMRVAMQMGCYPVDGIGMVLYQAAPAFERWYGRRPEVDQTARAVATGAYSS
ncbi:shikimate dehydrogenase family protein [Sinisalibacter aestuarii]|uniref:shikimate dehydrogenase (NADP(+)) n=1 Tax=Sinisalibacter aestuarii TaxID=2949426 RepID=A0ABQ5LN59_9RHOB|nr:shikimate dehydrogenase [Sinisalibacter aestuarii]GKY86447.1 shikimate dehydrogenase (NADP(+)) [Sinisalibacter aestuarii]